MLETIQGEILNKTTELNKSNFADFFKPVTEKHTKTASVCQQQTPA